MNKFARIVLGLKALLGQKAPKSAVTDTNSQLDWDNHQISLEDGEWWISEVAATTQPKSNLGKVVFVPDDNPFETCTSCNNDKFVGSSKVEAPFICGWCQAEDVYVRALIKAEKAEIKETEAMLLKEVTLDRLSDAVDALCKGNRLSDAVDSLCKEESWPEPEWLEDEECQCSDEGCYRCNPL